MSARKLVSTLAALTLAALAQGALAQGGPGSGPGNCAQARNPQHCEQRMQAAQACQGERGPARRQCMHDRMPPVDCAKAPNPQRCEQHKQAYDACKAKPGPDFRACMQEKGFGPRGGARPPAAKP